jgi:hypothetical protein
MGEASKGFWPLPQSIPIHHNSGVFVPYMNFLACYTCLLLKVLSPIFLFFLEAFSPQRAWFFFFSDRHFLSSTRCPPGGWAGGAGCAGWAGPAAVPLRTVHFDHHHQEPDAAGPLRAPLRLREGIGAALCGGGALRQDQDQGGKLGCVATRTFSAFYILEILTSLTNCSYLAKNSYLVFIFTITSTGIIGNGTSADSSGALDKSQLTHMVHA